MITIVTGKGSIIRVADRVSVVNFLRENKSDKFITIHGIDLTPEEIQSIEAEAKYKGATEKECNKALDKLPQTLFCKKCGYVWLPRIAKPIKCPSCLSRKWNE